MRLLDAVALYTGEGGAFPCEICGACVITHEVWYWQQWCLNCGQIYWTTDGHLVRLDVDRVRWSAPRAEDVVSRYRPPVRAAHQPPYSTRVPPVLCDAFRQTADMSCIHQLLRRKFGPLPHHGLSRRGAPAKTLT